MFTIVALVNCLQQHFILKDLGFFNFFLCINATRTSVGHHLSWSKYISEMLNNTKMLGAKLAKTPLLVGSKLSQYDGDPLPTSSKYWYLVGTLQYYTLTRPDIAFPINWTCQFMHNPTTV